MIHPSPKGEMKLTILGSMGWIPTRGQHTCCYSLEHQDILIILDAGTGLARFSEPWGQEILKRYPKVLLILSHYHLDHLAGLIYIPQFFKNKEIHLAGPGKGIYLDNMRDILDRLISPPYFGRTFSKFPMDITFHDLEIGSNSILGLEIDTILQQHSDPSIGIKIDHVICYITDTPCNDQTLEFVKGCKMLLHESWIDNKEFRELQDKTLPSSPQAEKILASHSHVQQVARIASLAAVESLVLIHLNPSYDEKRLNAMEQDAQNIFPSTQLARDRLKFIVDID